MTESKAVRYHQGDKTLKKSRTSRGIVSTARSEQAKKSIALKLWRKVGSDYLKKGGFTAFPKTGTKEHKTMLTLYDIEMKKAGLR